MSEIINFNDLKNKATDKDLDKFEQYMYSLYSSVVQGTLTMSDFMEKIQEYMGKNNISQEKFVNIQKKLMENVHYDLRNEIRKSNLKYKVDENLGISALGYIFTPLSKEELDIYNENGTIEFLIDITVDRIFE